MLEQLKYSPCCIVIAENDCTFMYMCMYVCVCVCVYIYIYILVIALMLSYYTEGLSDQGYLGFLIVSLVLF